MLTKRGAAKRSAEKRRAAILAVNAVATHCPEGHRLTPENTLVVGPRKVRVCKFCRQAKSVAAKRARAVLSSKATEKEGKK